MYLQSDKSHQRLEFIAKLLLSTKTITHFVINHFIFNVY